MESIPDDIAMAFNGAVRIFKEGYTVYPIPSYLKSTIDGIEYIGSAGLKMYVGKPGLENFIEDGKKADNSRKGWKKWLSCSPYPSLESLKILEKISQELGDKNIEPNMIESKFHDLIERLEDKFTAEEYRKAYGRMKNPSVAD